jgi:probable rRNA maturation factor
MIIELAINDNYQIIKKPAFERLIKNTLKVLGKEMNVKVSLYIVTNSIIKSINKKYRKKDEVTDVLSFPFIYGGNNDNFVLPASSIENIGEIIISYPQAIKQARQMKHSVLFEVKSLFIHGLLHLFGYNHDTDEDEGAMKNLEQRIIKKK